MLPSTLNVATLQSPSLVLFSSSLLTKLILIFLYFLTQFFFEKIVRNSNIEITMIFFDNDQYIHHYEVN